MLSCLGGELGQLLSECNAGTEYTESDAESLHAVFGRYLTDLNLLEQQRHNTQKMAEALFDRKQTYAALAAFILGSKS